LSDYAPFADQRPYQTNFEQNYQPQQFQHNFEQSYPAQPASQYQNPFQNPPAPYYANQLPPPPAYYGNQNDYSQMHQTTCIKCGVGNNVCFQNFKKNYVPPYVFLGAFLGVLPMIILIAVLQINHQINAPFCLECWKNFRKAGTIETLTTIGAFCGFIFAIFAGFAAESRWVLLFLLAAVGGVVVLGQKLK
jgi:hypothetical protein